MNKKCDCCGIAIDELHKNFRPDRREKDYDDGWFYFVGSTYECKSCYGLTNQEYFNKVEGR